jgi:hypothetical protein
MLKNAHAWQEEVFNQLTDDWPPDQRRAFQQAMTTLIDRSYTLNA